MASTIEGLFTSTGQKFAVFRESQTVDCCLCPLQASKKLIFLVICTSMCAQKYSHLTHIVRYWLGERNHDKRYTFELQDYSFNAMMSIVASGKN